MNQPVITLQVYVDSLVEKATLNDAQAELRLSHYIWLVLISIPLSLGFGVKNLWSGNYEICIALAIFFVCMTGSLLLIPRIHKTERIYQVNNFIFVLMVTLVSVWGAKSEGQILWSYTYPLLSISLFGHRFGLRWSIGLLVIILLSLELSNSFIPTYSNDFKARYCITYLCILMITSWLEYGRSRFIQVSAEQKQRLETERGYLKREIKKREALETELQKQANIDDLTQLYNHRYFWSSASEEISRVQSLHATATLAILDIDRFKKINDGYGHPAGDEVLKYFGQYCKKHLRKSDTAGRIGGEEFAILLPYTNIEEAKNIMERFCQQIRSHHFTFQGDTKQVTVSVGLCELDNEASDIGRLYFLADQALYDAKASGRDRIECR